MRQILIAADQLLNTLLLGWADETLSARAWRLRHKKHWEIARWCIDRVFFWEGEHCAKAHQAQFKRGVVCPKCWD